MLKISILICTFMLTVVTGEKGFKIALSTDGTYSLWVDGNKWLSSGDTFFMSQGRKYSMSDDSLKMANVSATSGTDKVGQWQNIQYFYYAGSQPVLATIKTYNVPDLPLAIFSQTYLQNWTGTSAQDPNYVTSGFPTFKTGSASDVDLGYLAYGGDMSGYTGLNMGSWSFTSYFETGTGGGPLVLFDNASNAMVISPMSQFMSASSHVSLTQQQVSYGVLGLVDTIPSGYQVDFLVYFDDRGINQAVREWGAFLQFYYDKVKFNRLKSLTLNYLGYWTDNGAYYYYHTEEGKNYQTSMVDAASYIKNISLPVQYLQYDSWWYPKGHRQGTVTWTPRKDVLPDGFQYLSAQTQLPFGCHNRYWDSQTTYAKYNGGQYNFIQDRSYGLSVPDDQKFWDDLFTMTKQWGNFILYEQDWLNWEFDQNVALLSDVSLGRRWLTQMGNGASQYLNIEIQYCMAYSRHILQSLEIDAVTQARVSHDYSPGGRQWNIGYTSMFADAVGLAPFKDTFWTTEKQPGSPYGSRTEKFTRLNAVIATLSTGPVGPGDGIGYINSTLLMKCCDNSGRILQPDRAATAIDDQIKKKAFPNYSGPRGEVYTTYTNVSGLIFGIVLAAELTNEYALTPTSGWTYGLLRSPAVVYSGTDLNDLPVPFSVLNPLYLGPGCTAVDFCLYYTSPVLQLQTGDHIVLLGERDKWTPFSIRRFMDIRFTTSDVIALININAYEAVSIYFQINSGPVERVICDNSQSYKKPSFATISIMGRKCTLQ
ncbi:hypothetical protein BgiMline_023964 [Biomphalaria glabrata]